MLITLQNIKGQKRPAKHRVGRGNSSGSGTYAGRGLKGQKARSGGRGGLKLMGLKQTITKHQKYRGMRPVSEKYAVVNIGTLEKHCENNQQVNLSRLIALGLVVKTAKAVKVLSEGKLSKKLIIKAHAFSAAAKSKIEQAGGQVVLIQPKKTKKKDSE